MRRVLLVVGTVLIVAGVSVGLWPSAFPLSAEESRYLVSLGTPTPSCGSAWIPMPLPAADPNSEASLPFGGPDGMARLYNQVCAETLWPKPVLSLLLVACGVGLLVALVLLWRRREASSLTPPAA